ncbi:MAG: (Fe-S)-binding protein [Chromatiaceae bacterium]|nr:(Fe-S)-binding protein [Gammaproteobacteria bacterium]MCP5300738.1 (Fe-S)-binding protein [Chromatiaceae bacterium]MCP5422810.1 (Fe-S)-binding protein [Chromatiaceae bacterium]
MLQSPDPELLREADRCVKCGLCLPECPTYRLTRDENESPRGRIALIEGLARSQLDPRGRSTTHLDSCLACRRCERVCPSQVRYGGLIQRAYVDFAVRTPRPLDSMLADPRVLRLAGRMARTLPAALSRPFAKLHRMQRVARALGDGGIAPTPGEYTCRATSPRGRVGLFLGCATAAYQGRALGAAVTLLTHAGFDTVVATGQRCCGALELHAGNPAAAARRADVNRIAFDAALDAVVSVASGCGIHLDAYDPPLPARHFDILRFLLERGGLTTHDFLPLRAAVLLHTPCSMENVYRGGDWAPALLGLIDGLEVVALGERGQCCGAAGDHMLRYPQVACELRQPLLETIGRTQSTLLLTTNVGCAMHLAEGLGDDRASLRVLHPVELLAGQLRERPSGEVDQV